MRFHFVIGIIVWASTCVVLGAQCSDGTAENALIRLGLEVGEGKVDDFEKFYDETLLPILQSYGAVAHPEMGRPTHPAYFSRLFEVDCPAQIRKLKNDLAGDKNWQRAMVELVRYSAQAALKRCHCHIM